MKHLLTILSGLLVALLFARCADDDNLSGGIDGLPERGIVIRLSTGELDTRTQLTSTGDYHHVKEVWAVLYKWNGNESTDPNDPNNHGNYEFKSATLLKLENGKPWNPYDASTQPRPSKGDDQTDEEYDAALDAYLENMQTNYGGEYGNGKVQGREFVLPETNDMTNGTYRVLCIGLDDKSGAVYDLKKKDGNLNLGSTLAEAKAKMTIETKAYEEQTGTYQMYGYDGTGELFAGWTEFEFEPDNINIAEVELKRRVAGILCYVTDIPAKIENTEVKGIRLCLNTKANGEIGLCRLDKPWEDFGAGGGGDASSYGGTTLAYRDLSDWKADGEILTNDEGKNLTMGVYLIPIDVVNDSELGSNFNTLSVQLFGGENYQFNKETGKVTGGEPIKTFNVLNEQGHTDRGETADRYNILPNYIYHIGDKDDDIDEPMSLLGQKITVVPEEWREKTIPVEFPSVPIKPKMDIPYGASYVFDCIPQTITIEVTNSILNSPWTLQAGNGIYFKTDEGYSYQYEAKSEDYQKDGPVEVEMLIADFAELDAPEMREIEIKLLGEDKTTVVATHTVKQYSAIVVETEENVYRGFSRFDLGTDRNSVDGSVISNEGTRPWNYYYSRYGTISNWSAGDIYGTGASESLGETNLINAKSKAEQEGEFTLFNFVGPQNYEDDYDSKWADIVTEESAIYAAGLSSYTGGATSASLNGHYWYLPAHNEMEAFIKKAVKDKKIEEWNLVRQRSSDSKDDLEHHKYWTSTAYGTLTAHTHYINTKGEGAHDTPTGNDYRTYWRHVRRACDITSINN